MLRKLFSDTVLYGLGNMVPRFLNFLLFPLHTSIFYPAEYGVYTYLMSIVAFVNVVYSFGMETAYFRYATKPGANPEKVFNVAQTVVVGVSALFSIIIIFAAPVLAPALGAEQKVTFIHWLTAIMFIDNIVAIPFARLRLERKPLRFALFKIANVVLLVALNLYFLKVVYTPVFGIGFVFLANLVANATYLLFFAGMLSKWRPVFDHEQTPVMVRYAYPVMLTGLAGMTNEFFSRVSLEKWLPDNFYPMQTSAYALGVFGACYKFSVFMSLVVQAFRFAAEPFFFSHASDKKSPQLFARVNHYFIIVCCFILVAIGINLDIVKYLLRQEAYWDGMAIVPPLLLGYLLLGVYYNLTIWFKLTDKTYAGTIITATGAVLTVALNYWLIPLFGYLGSAWVTAAVYGFMMLACYAWGQRAYPIPYRWLAGTLYIGGSMALVLAVNEYVISGSAEAIMARAGILAAWLVVVFLLEYKGLVRKPASIS